MLRLWAPRTPRLRLAVRHARTGHAALLAGRGRCSSTSPTTPSSSFAAAADADAAAADAEAAPPPESPETLGETALINTLFMTDLTPVRVARLAGRGRGVVARRALRDGARPSLLHGDGFDGYSLWLRRPILTCHAISAQAIISSPRRRSPTRR